MRKHLSGIFVKQTAGLDLLRLVLCAILFTHGAYRLYEGSTPVLGEILTEIGFPFGVVLAYLVCIAETLGALAVALRLFVTPMCLVLITIYATGIVLFHGARGFFVVGPGTGGWEYSALLITCLSTTIWANLGRRRA